MAGIAKGRTAVHLAQKHVPCFAQRMEAALGHIERGEWALGHAITQGARQCSARRGCAFGEECSVAACHMLREIRNMLGN